MKTNLKICVIALVTIIGMKAARAQTDKLSEAFSTSYADETKSDFTKAISTLKSVYDDKSYEINLRLGWLNYEAGLYTESQNYYQKAIDLMPYAIEPKMGYVYPAAALGNMDAVMAQYAKVLETDPQNSTVNYRVGNICYGKKDYTNAYKYFEKVVNLYPFSYDALIMFAWSNYQLGKTREAKVLFGKVMLLSPGDKSAAEGLALIK